MDERTAKKLADLTATAIAKASACQLMIKILLHFHFAEMPDSAAQAADFREKVMQYIENSYKFPNNPEFERKIRKEFEFLLNGEIFNESSFTDLMSDFIS